MYLWQDLLEGSDHVDQVKRLIDLGGDAKQAEAINGIQATMGELRSETKRSSEILEDLMMLREEIKDEISRLEMAIVTQNKIIDIVDDKEIQLIRDQQRKL